MLSLSFYTHTLGIIQLKHLLQWIWRYHQKNNIQSKNIGNNNTNSSDRQEEGKMRKPRIFSINKSSKNSKIDDDGSVGKIKGSC